MSVKIRLARRGRKKRPFYHIVVADARAPRDGRFIENIGAYNPMTTPATIELDVERAYEWLMNGAQPTNTARAILRFKGVLYKKHLQRGVTKGALTQEQADEMLKDWVTAKDAKVAERFEQSRKEKEDFRKMVSGEIKAAVKESADEESQEAFRETTEEVASTTTEETPAEAAAPEVVEEAAVEEATEAPEPVAEAVPEATEEVAEATEEATEATSEEAPSSEEE